MPLQKEGHFLFLQYNKAMSFTQFQSSFFQGNRERLIALLPSNALVVLAANGEMQQEIDTSYPFLQEANFWYLTGVDAADWRLIIDAQDGKSWLVPAIIDEVQEVFNGSLPIAAATEKSGITEVLSPLGATKLIGQYVTKGRKVHSIAPQKKKEMGFYTNPSQAMLWQRLRQYKPTDIRALLHKLRGVKQAVEVAAIQDSVDVTVRAVNNLLPLIKDMAYEYQVEGFISGFFRSQGAMGHAYAPIIAAGANACTLHYNANQAELQLGQMLLMDVGARATRYSADITRTIPLGMVRDEDVKVYMAVERVHDFALSLCRPGQSVQEYITKIDDCMLEQLIELGLAKDMKDREALRKYFPHAVSHGLGVETHDPLGAPAQFNENMVLTVEPGIYIPERSLGIRIENDILVTKDEPRNLSERLPYNLQKIQEMI